MCPSLNPTFPARYYLGQDQSYRQVPSLRHGERLVVSACAPLRARTSRLALTRRTCAIMQNESLGDAKSAAGGGDKAAFTIHCASRPRKKPLVTGSAHRPALWPQTLSGHRAPQFVLFSDNCVSRDDKNGAVPTVARCAPPWRLNLHGAAAASRRQQIPPNRARLICCALF